MFTRKRHLARHYEFTIRLNRSVVCVFGVVHANARAIAVAVRGKEPVTRQEVGIRLPSIRRGPVRTGSGEGRHQ